MPAVSMGCGTKIINAEPANRWDVLGASKKPGDLDADPGYRVVYADGYVSWSPKEVFEAAYREVSRDEAFVLSQMIVGAIIDKLPERPS